MDWKLYRDFCFLCLCLQLWGCGEEKSPTREIKDTVRSLRAEVQAELDSGLKELELQPVTTSEMDSEEENHTSAALNMGKTAYSTRVRVEIHSQSNGIKCMRA